MSATDCPQFAYGDNGRIECQHCGAHYDQHRYIVLRRYADERTAIRNAGLNEVRQAPEYDTDPRRWQLVLDREA